jgi:hypothetical protein
MNSVLLGHTYVEDELSNCRRTDVLSENRCLDIVSHFYQAHIPTKTCAIYLPGKATSSLVVRVFSDVKNCGHPRFQNIFTLAFLSRINVNL